VRRENHELGSDEVGAMSEIKTHRDIIAWQRGRTLVKELYRVTRELPGDERFGLTLQMRRAAVSIPSNIAEGFGRGTTAEFLRFLRIARGSLAELDTQMTLCIDLEYLTQTGAIPDLLAETDRVLQGLIRSLENKLEPQLTVQ
jgi:four helix bundle protein